MSAVEKAIARVEQLGAISDSQEYLVRTFLSAASKRAAGTIYGWMQELGMVVEHSADGTLRGILTGSHPSAKPLLLGSHYDTVPDAGKYDGPLGIISALAALEMLRDENVTLPFPVHVLAFSDEEGTRFQTTYLGSSAVAGCLNDESILTAKDANGITVRDAIDIEGWHQGATQIVYPPGTTRGYVELHIEQGRVLEEMGEPASVVSSIAGQARLTVKLTGRTDHAGTTPMPLRRDALAGAAACIVAAEDIAKSSPPLVITVGMITVHPGASNSVPQSATFTIDLRHPDNSMRTMALEALEVTCRDIARSRNLTMDWTVMQEKNATPCDPGLSDKLATALLTITGSQRTLVSGAGHDGVIISKIAPIAMLFIRCRDGLSHHPDEYASPSDIGTGIAILAQFLKSFPKDLAIA